jgi:hypothetical protein
VRVLAGSDVGQDAGQRAGYPGEVERGGEHVAVADLPARAGAQEAPQLLFAGPGPLGGLLDEGAERAEFALLPDQLLGRRDTERADQLVFQVGDAAARVVSAAWSLAPSTSTAAAAGASG